MATHQMEWVPSSFSTLKFATAIVVGAVSYLILVAVTNFLTSRVPKSVPGPFLAKVTPKWLLWVHLSGLRARTVHKLHQKYGPVVQLAPDEVSFSAPECVKPIYGPGTSCIKSSAYSNFGKLGVFQMQDPEQHRQRQQRVAHIFAPSLLKQMEPLIQNVVGDVMAAITERLGKPIDALHWFRVTALDISGEVLLGKSFGAIKSGGDGPEYVHHLDNAFLVWALYGLSPGFSKFLSLLPFKGLQEFMAAGEYVYKYGDNALKEYINRHGRNSSRRSLLTKILAGNPEKDTEPLSDPEISVEVSNLVFAATDTTGNTMTYAVYRLCCHPEWQDKLRKEIRASRARETGFAYQTLQALPVLNAIFMEILRLHPAAPSALPRVTTAKSTTIAGIQFPSRTLVSMQAYTTQRNPTFFPRPDEFDPDRWISEGAINPGTLEARGMMFVWGKGPRACLGQYMATMETKILLARLIDCCEARLEGPQTHSDMEMMDHFTLVPKGKKCGLVFTKAD